MARSTERSARSASFFLSLSLASARWTQATTASTLSSEGGGGLNGFDTVAAVGFGFGGAASCGFGDHAVWTSEVNICKDPLTILMASLQPSDSPRQSGIVEEAAALLLAVVDRAGAGVAAVRAREGGGEGTDELDSRGASPNSAASWDGRSALASDGFEIECRIPSDTIVDEGAIAGGVGGEEMSRGRRLELTSSTQGRAPAWRTGISPDQSSQTRMTVCLIGS